MTQKEFLEELDSMIDAEMNITNLQSDEFNEDLLKTLWKVKAMAMELEYEELGGEQATIFV